MTLTLEMDADLAKALQEQASARGESAETYASALLRQRLSAQDRSARVDEAIRKLSSSSNTFNRDGMTWREVSHEGHKY